MIEWGLKVGHLLPPIWEVRWPEVDDRAGLDLPNNLIPTIRCGLFHHAGVQHGVQLFGTKAAINSAEVSEVLSGFDG